MRGIDRIIHLYYTKGVVYNVQVRMDSSGMFFDAEDYLNRGYMYDTDDNFVDAYDLNVNVVLLMGIPLENVKITDTAGANATNKTQLPVLTNVYVDADLDKLDSSINGSAGIIEFNKLPPKVLPITEKGKIILHKLGDSITINSVHTLDFSKTTDYDESKIVNPALVGVKEVFYGNTVGNVGSAITTKPIYYRDGVQVEGSGSGRTPTNANNRAWEKSGRGGTIPTGPVN